MRFAVLALDKPDSLALRQATRPAHLDYMANFATPVGGPLLDDAGNMCGSLVMYDADSAEQVAEIVANDPYQLAGLFESVVIREFKTVAWPA